jgi:anti-anti-sigma factor
MGRASEIEVVREGRTGTVRAAGEIDLAETQRLEAALRTLQDGSADAIVLDLREVTFLDSTALRALTSADVRARQEGYELKIVRGSEPVQAILHLTGLDKILPLVDDPHDTPARR